MVKYSTESERLNNTFSALADPTRREILLYLVSGEATVKELAEPFNMSLPGISKHLKVLEKAGLIERSKEAQWRPCKIRPDGLKEASGWLDHYKHFWEESLDRLDAYLQQLQAKNKNPEGPDTQT
ncbi:ArsR/SmtB family transcription factor [Leptospira haakeii]|uniref:Transcriptional regulator n=1 Tax=Leptospira haakeii TaxID=2023198 RepID=A0ABX4PMN2_9LEPT|nr:metalloregulator ArsR/SmtB family transcription factor [Leptospira haakeii]PKA17046.1 transcriptional regulator [Leptospira haakeii]PKA20105.1 transcriptional regulator [Leptospira haakeii]